MNLIPLPNHNLSRKLAEWMCVKESVKLLYLIQLNVGANNSGKMNPSYQIAVALYYLLTSTSSILTLTSTITEY